MTLLKNILTTTLIAGIFALHPSLNKGNTPITALQYLVYGNSLNISTNSTIDKTLLEIKWVCATKNIACKDLVVFKNGEQINDIPFEKGNQKLVVFYDGDRIGEMLQNKIIKNQSHEYKIELSSKNEVLFFKGKIIGPAPHHSPAVTIATL